MRPSNSSTTRNSPFVIAWVLTILCCVAGYLAGWMVGRCYVLPMSGVQVVKNISPNSVIALGDSGGLWSEGPSVFADNMARSRCKPKATVFSCICYGRGAPSLFSGSSLRELFTIPKQNNILNRLTVPLNEQAHGLGKQCFLLQNKQGSHSEEICQNPPPS